MQRFDDKREIFKSTAEVEKQTGDVFVIETLIGGGYGKNSEIEAKVFDSCPTQYYIAPRSALRRFIALLRQSPRGAAK